MHEPNCPCLICAYHRFEAEVRGRTDRGVQPIDSTLRPAYAQMSGIEREAYWRRRREEEFGGVREQGG